MQGLIGQSLGGYRIISQIGKGGMATVFKAYQSSLDRYVAIKVLPPYYAEQDETFLKRFRQEAKAIASLRHPNILIVLDFGDWEQTTYLVMEFVEAGTLATHMGNPMAPARMAKVIGQVAAALQYAHQEGVIHRDIKPSNILLPKPDWPLLTDFGLAKIVGGAKITTSGNVAGTPAYMSPEQGRGDKVDQRSDIYSLGVVLYEMATGVVPFEAETPMAVIVKHIIDPLPLPRSKYPELAEGIERVILKALSKDPADRFQEVTELSEALSAAVGTLPKDQAAVEPVRTKQPLTTLQALDLHPSSQSPVAVGLHPSQMTNEAVAVEGPPSGRRSRWLRFAVGAGVLLFAVLSIAGARAIWSRAEVSGLIGSGAVDSRTIEQVIADGHARFAEGDYESAIRDFEIAVERDPGNPDRYFDLARAFSALGSSDAASESIQQAIDLAPDDSGMHESAGWVYQELGMPQAAADEFRTALELNPDAHWLYAAMSDSYVSAGMMEEAAAVLAEAIANPAVTTNPVSLESVGWGFLNLGDEAQAELAFTQSITGGADFPGPWEGLANVAYNRGDLYAALAVVDDGLQYFPGHIPFFEKAGELHWELGELELAATSFQQAIALDPANNASYSKLAGVYSQMTMLAEAEQLLLGGVAAYPENPGFQADLASFYKEQGRYPEAAPLYVALTQAEPENGWWYAYLAEVHINLGDPDNALQALGQAAARSSGDPWLNDFIGWLYVGLGDCDHAIVYFRTALELDPSIDSSVQGLQSCGG